MPRNALILILLLFLTSSGFCLDVRSAHSISQGGSSRALIDPVDSLYMNPAALAHFRNRYISSLFREGETAISLYDSAMNNPLSGALGYYQKTPLDKNSKSPHLQVFSFGISTPSPDFNSGTELSQWSMGLSIHQNRKITEVRTQTLNTFDLGFLFTPKSYLGIGLVIYNISQNPENEFSEFLNLNQVGVGSNFIYTEHLRVKLDWISSENGSYENSIISSGFETFYSNWFKLGFGINQNLTSSLIHYSFGFGFIGPKFNVHYAYVTAKENDLDSSHSIDLAIPF